MSDTKHNQITRELEQARAQLLDLSMRNRMLNFRPTKLSSIHIVDERPDEVYDRLVVNEKLMQLRPKSEEKASSVIMPVGKTELELQDEDAKWNLDTSAIPSQHMDRYLQTDIPAGELEKRSRSIYQRSASVFEEQGFTVSFLALGFLEWKESPDAVEIRKAPLILIPVELERKKISSSYNLRWTGEDIFTNVSLQSKLSEQGINMPDFEMAESKEEINTYSKRCIEAVSTQKEWRITQGIYLGFFSFAKFVMYRDLDPGSWPVGLQPASHPLIRDLFLPEGDIESIDDFFGDEQEVSRLSIKRQFHVMDADASQVSVIEAVKDGKNLVVEGPPGTGKSQTITNLVAELLKNNKSVLFVSEKMAALEVVKNRLDKCGLADACLELHSRHTKKRSFVDELDRTIRVTPSPIASLEDELHQHDQLSNVLNGFVNAIKKPITMGLSPFAFLGQRERTNNRLAKRSKSLIPVELGHPDGWTREKYNDTRSKLRQLSDTLPTVSPLKSHPWRACSPEVSVQADVDIICNSISEFRLQLIELENLLSEMEICTAIRIPINQADTEKAIEAGDLMSRGIPIPRGIVENNEWDSFSSNAAHLIDRIRSIQNTRNDFKHRMNPQIQSYPFGQLLGVIDKVTEQLVTLNGKIGELELLSATGPSTDLRHAEKSIEAAKLMAKSNPVDRHVLQNGRWNEVDVEAKRLISSLCQVQSIVIDLSSYLSPQAFYSETRDLRNALFIKNQQLFKHLSPEYWHLKSSVRNLYKDGKKRTVTTMLNDLDSVIDCIDLRQELVNNDERGKFFFGRYWRGEKSEVEELNQFVQWIVSFRQHLIQGDLTEHAVGLVENGLDAVKLMSLVREIETVYLAALKSMGELARVFGTDVSLIFSAEIHHVSYGDWEDKLLALRSSVDNVDQWSQWMINDHENIPSPSKSLLDAYYHPPTTSPMSNFTEDSGKITSALAVLEDLRKNSDRAVSLFGPYWQAEESNPDELEEVGKWIVCFRRLHEQGSLLDRAITLAEENKDRTEMKTAVQAVQSHWEQVRVDYDKLRIRLKFAPPRAFSESAHLVTFKDWKCLLHDWLDNRSMLLRWAQWVNLREGIKLTSARPILAHIEEGNLDSDEILPTFDGNIAETALRLAFKTRPELGNFIGDVHEKNIRDFRLLDERIIQLNRQSIAQILQENRPRISGGASTRSEAGILLGQIGRKRGIMSIRSMMNKIGTLIQKIKPCMLMSPVSVAQYLGPEFPPFDVIIFDEASQVRPEDSLGALLRGKQLVVMGDTKQLPPTTFFDRIGMEESIEELEDEEMGVTSIADVESILHQCKRSFPTKMLRWHYRSHHESLIAVSNQEFYDNRLLVYPSAADRISHLGLELIHLPEAKYDRGRSSTNQIEARAIMKAALEHYRQYPEKSLGIGTFSMKQQQAILDEQDRILRENQDMEGFFSPERDEHFFVKNLETIQGDERDVIFISIAYGFDVEGKLHKQFGPLNKQGGERRLNVLMTRARDRCVIFSNFRAQDLMTEHNEAVGVRALKIFLDYAEHRNLDSITETGADSDSPFEDGVYSFLQEHGFTLRKQVGCAAFRIDIGVVNPDSPGRYLLGIVCDGAPYHSSPVARDRDRLRQQMLENLGWYIHRIWSTDWYRNRAGASERLLRAIESVKGKPLKHTRISGQPIVPVIPSKTLDEESPVLADQRGEIPAYITCQDFGIPIVGELHKLWTSRMSTAIVNIVKVEHPVHLDEIVRRLRTAWGLSRAGNRIREAIKIGIEDAVSNNSIKQRGDFLWDVTEKKVPVRRRFGDPPAKIEYICNEEIAEAVRMVLRAQFGTERNALAIQTAKTMGFHAVHTVTVHRVTSVIKDLLRTDQLKRRENGMVELP